MSVPPLTLPTLDSLNVSPVTFNKDPSLNPTSVAQSWIDTFSKSLTSSKDVKQVLDLFLENSWWRDLLALTWDFRSFHGHDKIGKFITDRVIGGSLKDIALITSGEGTTPVLAQPFPDLAFIQFFFSFKTTNGGEGKGFVRLAPTNSPNNDKLIWKAFTILTALEALTGHPEKIGSLRDHTTNNQWTKTLEEALEFRDREPAVVIIGAGQSGLDVAARLSCMGVDTLVLEKNEFPGQQWTNRYKTLTLHDPVWYDHMPYLPFPPNWPVYAPAPKLAQWLRSYADFMELKVWTKTQVHHVHRDEQTKMWQVKVTRERIDASGKVVKEERVVKPRHVVFAMGLFSGVKNMPKYPGMDTFKGKLVHAFDHSTAAAYIGKKVLVVGACTSAHDIAQDFHNHGVDVTMYQRSSTYIMSVKNGWAVLFSGTYEEGGPPTEVADLLSASLPRDVEMLVAKRATGIIADLDKPLLDGLTKAGFQLNMGIDGSGFGRLAWTRGGGYYLDCGASKIIAEGGIKLISSGGKGGKIEKFTEKGVKLEDGSEREFDVVIFATGFGDGRGPIKDLIGPELGAKLGETWGLNDEGEINSIWRGTGVDRLYVMMGNLMLCRFHSRHIALQIKAMEEGVWDGKRYSLAG